MWNQYLIFYYTNRYIITQVVMTEWRCRTSLPFWGRTLVFWGLSHPHPASLSGLVYTQNIISFNMYLFPLAAFSSFSDVKILYGLLFFFFQNALGLQAVWDFYFGSSLVNTVTFQVQWSVDENMVREEKKRKYFCLAGSQPEERGPYVLQRTRHHLKTNFHSTLIPWLMGAHVYNKCSPPSTHPVRDCTDTALAGFFVPQDLWTWCFLFFKKKLIIFIFYLFMVFPLFESSSSTWPTAGPFSSFRLWLKIVMPDYPC